MRPARHRDPPQVESPARGITFDLWGTLLHLRPKEARRYEKRRQQVWLDTLRSWQELPGVRPIVPSETRALKMVFAEARSRAALGESVSVEFQSTRAAFLLGRRPELGEIASQLEPIIADLGVHVPAGMRQALANLSSSGTKLGVVSNTLFEPAPAMRRLLAHRHLLRYFTSVQLSEELPWTKPSPEIFRDCLHEMAVRPSCAWHVGDSPEDAEGAFRTGMAGAILVGRSGTPRIRSLPGRRTSLVRCADARGLVRMLEQVDAPWTEGASGSSVGDRRPTSWPNSGLKGRA